MLDLNQDHKYKNFVMIFFLNQNYFLKFMKLSFFIGVMQGILQSE